MRNITKENVGDSAVYPASDLSAAITGAAIRVDAGMHIMCPPTGPRKKDPWPTARKRGEMDNYGG